MNTTQQQRVGIVVSVIWLICWLGVAPAYYSLYYHSASAAIADCKAKAKAVANAKTDEAKAKTANAKAALDKATAGTAAYAAAYDAYDDARTKGFAASARAFHDYADAIAKTADIAKARAATAHRRAVVSIFIGIIPLVIGWGYWWIRRK